MQKNSSSNLAQQICKISFVETKNCQLAKGSDKNHVAISFLNGAALEDLYFSPGSIDFKEDEKEFPAGNLFQQQIACSIPGVQHDNRTFFDNARNLRVILVMTFQNGSKLLIGSIQNPMQVKSSYAQSKNAHQVEFNRTGSKALWLD